MDIYKEKNSYLQTPSSPYIYWAEEGLSHSGTGGILPLHFVLQKILSVISYLQKFSY